MATENIEDITTTPRFIPSTRFTIALLVSFALFTQYEQRQSLAIAIVCMVNKTSNNIKVNSTLHLEHNTTVTPSVKDTVQFFKEKTFHWNEFEQQIILGAYWAGYILTLVPGGWLSMSIGAKRVFSYCLLTSSLATLALSVIYTMADTQFLFILIVVLRIIAGLGHGALFPATYTVWVSWAVPNERGTLTAISFSGTHVGTSTMMLIGGIFCRYMNSGWMYIFILSSIVGFIWFPLWLWLVTDSPREHKKINQIERNYICNIIGRKTNNKSGHLIALSSLPWKKIVRSKPIIALFITHSCNVFGLFFFYTNIGKILTEIHGVSTQKTGYLLAVGYIIMALCSLLSGIVSDLLVKKNIMSLTSVRKLFNSLTSFIPVICMCVLCFCDETRQILGMGTLLVYLGSSGFGYGAGYVVNFADVVPAYSSLLFGLSITFGSLASLSANVLAGFLIKQPILSDWRYMFIIFMLVYTIGGLVYLAFGSAIPRKWAINVNEEHNTNIDNEASIDPSETMLKT
ncbi:unnamed protein product [Rotaria sordida]|uniref:Major facilitator superfamily (MFS) profile domain-containing protein n=1 Tax=Rotaria sordida TaxID=392033 RepID=A0A814NZR2_9BILA|nr:unnamed protein product [Rotaria sordida]CAF1304015.1 unnamed protein product [Rotaria sordida]